MSDVTLAEEVERTKSFSQSINLFVISQHYLSTGSVSHSTSVPISHSISNKKRNNLIKQINGNGQKFSFNLSLESWLEKVEK